MKLKSNSRQFATKLKQLRNATDVPFQKVLSAFMIKWLTETCNATPVSIYEREDPGRLQGSWSISRDQPGRFMIPKGVSSSTDEAVARARRLMFSNPYAAWFLYNRVPYGTVVELGLYPGDGPRTMNGYSKQAPAGMLRVTSAQLKRYLNELVIYVR